MAVCCNIICVFIDTTYSGIYLCNYRISCTIYVYVCLDLWLHVCILISIGTCNFFLPSMHCPTYACMFCVRYTVVLGSWRESSGTSGMARRVLQSKQRPAPVRRAWDYERAGSKGPSTQT